MKEIKIKFIGLHECGPLPFSNKCFNKCLFSNFVKILKDDTYIRKDGDGHLNDRYF